MKLAARLAVLLVAAEAARFHVAPAHGKDALSLAKVRGDVVTTSQANAPTNQIGGQFPGQEATELSVEAPGMCKVEPCMALGCCCWSTLYLEPHPDYPNPEVANRERHCTRGGLPAEYVLVKEPGYVGTDGQYEAQMANQNPDFGVGRDLCCVASKDDVITQASRASMQEEVPVIETTPPPLLVNPDPPAEETPPPEEAVPIPPQNLTLGNLTLGGHGPEFFSPNATHGKNHTNASNHSNASMAPVEASFAYARRASLDGGAVETEFERQEKESDGGFDYRDLPRLQAEAAAVMVSRGHLRAYR